MVVERLSKLLKNRDRTYRPAKAKAAIRTKVVAGSQTPDPGLVIISAPIKPTTIDSQRHKPTFSFKIDTPIRTKEWSQNAHIDSDSFC